MSGISPIDATRENSSLSLEDFWGRCLLFHYKEARKLGKVEDWNNGRLEQKEMGVKKEMGVRSTLFTVK